MQKKNQTVIVSNCDVISDLDYSDVLKYHKKNKALATMVVIQHENTNPYGVVTAKGNRFLGYLEKPLRIERINAGIYVFETKVFKFIQKNKYLDMNIFFSNLLKQKKNYCLSKFMRNGKILDKKNQILMDLLKHIEKFKK